MRNVLIASIAAASAAVFAAPASAQDMSTDSRAPGFASADQCVAAAQQAANNGTIEQLYYYPSIVTGHRAARRGETLGRIAQDRCVNLHIKGGFKWVLLRQGTLVHFRTGTEEILYHADCANQARGSIAVNYQQQARVVADCADCRPAPAQPAPEPRGTTFRPMMAQAPAPVQHIAATFVPQLPQQTIGLGMFSQSNVAVANYNTYNYPQPATPPSVITNPPTPNVPPVVTTQPPLGDPQPAPNVATNPGGTTQPPLVGTNPADPVPLNGGWGQQGTWNNQGGQWGTTGGQSNWYGNGVSGGSSNTWSNQNGGQWTSNGQNTWNNQGDAFGGPVSLNGASSSNNSSWSTTSGNSNSSNWSTVNSGSFGGPVSLQGNSSSTSSSGWNNNGGTPVLGTNGQ